MKTIKADKGKLLKLGNNIIGSVLYAPDNFDETKIIQVSKKKNLKEKNEYSRST